MKNKKNKLIEENNKSDEKDTELEQGKDMAKKRIYNPKTRKYYKLRERTTSRGYKGEIMGKWKQTKRKKKSFWDKW